MQFDLNSASSEYKENHLFSWVWRKCRRFSRLFGLICVLCLDFICFAGEVSENVPASLTGGTLTLLSIVGLISLPFTLHYIQKATVDLRFGFKASHAAVMLLSVGKLVELVCILTLVIGGFAAETAGQLGNADLQALLYEWMTPLGEGAVILGVILLIIYLYMDQRVINALDPKVFSIETEQKIIRAFRNQQESQDMFLAAEVRLCMDKDTLEHFLNTLKHVDSHTTAQNEIFKVVRDNITTQQKIALRGELLIIIAGYFCMGFQKYYTPNTLLSASIDLVLGSAYTIKVLIETIREVLQRKKMNKVVKERYELPKAKARAIPNATAQESYAR
jgi:hypothetical protein